MILGQGGKNPRQRRFGAHLQLLRRPPCHIPRLQWSHSVVFDNMTTYDPDLIDRFERYVDRTDAHGCHVWTGARRGPNNDYGRFRMSVNGFTYHEKAHRMAYQLYVGPIPRNMVVCHTCDNPGCVRTDHLFLGTHKENIHDAQKKGRFPSASKKSGVYLTWGQRKEIFYSDEDVRYLANLHGVGSCVIERIRRGRWTLPDKKA
jgi:hypothetical protein